MRNHKVAIQGNIASFHDLAARRFYGQDIEQICCHSFVEVCEKLNNNEADYAVMAIENSTAGSILSNYNLIQDFGFIVIGEIYERVQFHVLGVDGATIEDANQIISHPMALGQTQEFLAAHTHLVPVEWSDTASAAQHVAAANDTKLLAIANETTAETYGLTIIQRNIEANESNYTRFLVLAKGGTFPEDHNKASLSFHISHEPNALIKALQILGKEGMNCTKIQSVPLANSAFEFSFHLDVEYEQPLALNKALTALEQETKHVHLLGKYKKQSIHA